MPLPRIHLLALTLVLAACTVNPVTQRRQLVLTSEADEVAQGQQGAREVEQSLGLVPDPALNAYVDALGQRLVRQQGRDLRYHFHVVEMEAPNAFALPGGFIYVSRGLLAYVDSEDELACVIGHEIGHVDARHSVTQQARDRLLSPFRVLAGVGGSAVGLVSPELGAVVAGTAALPAALTMARYSREQERQADVLGQRFAAAEGWDPAAMSRFMTTLARETALEGDDPARGGLFDSHPPSPERSRETARHAKTLQQAPASPIAADRSAFLHKLSGVVVGTPAYQGVFVDQRFLHPDLGFALELPPGWQQHNGATAALAYREAPPAAVVLTLIADDAEPMAVAQHLARQVPFAEGPVPLTVSGLPAARGAIVDGRGPDAVRVQLTFVAFDGHVYQVASLARLADWPALAVPLERASNGLRPLREDERAEIFETRLRIHPAREGESLAELAARVGSTWQAPRLAVANALAEHARLQEGQLVKAPVREPYPGP